MIISYNAISELRNNTTPTGGDTVYVKYHTFGWDGGGGFFYYAPTETLPDNDGTIIQPVPLTNTSPPAGRWVRQIDDYINVKYFGTYGNLQPDDGLRIQKAIDYAYNNKVDNGWDRARKGTTVFIPIGNYKIHNTLFLKSGISIIGESLENTILQAGYPDELTPQQAITYQSSYGNHTLGMDNGRIEGCNISNLTFDGYVTRGSNWDASSIDLKTKSCMYFEAVTAPPYGDGGLWSCTFKNIRIQNYNGDGIEFIGGGHNDFLRPNQLCIFENVHVSRQKDKARSLVLRKEIGQFTFINCGFGGLLYDSETGRKALKETNCAILADGSNNPPAVISFINCTFQDAEYGVYIKYGQSITFDTCWFENLDLAVSAFNDDSEPKNGNYPSVSINILNSRFANAAGFGSIDIVNRNIIPGRCITSENSEINVHNNYVTVSQLKDDLPNSPFGKYFILALGDNLGVQTSGNTYFDSRLGYTYGLSAKVLVVGDTIDIKSNRSALVQGQSSTTAEIKTIISSCNAGERLTLRADTYPIKFSNAKNIFLSSKASVILNPDDIAEFVKLDIVTNGYIETYHLVSIFKATTAV